ncbi:hypothetical protein DLAC_11260 [Tieghemostelium lacteum]|uniref:Sm domain-containing protein n=1 Tax=Tieghemostelium lacteum TaxID=361077 RepID=A0A151Z3J8_TIELA|nr:hypothetical protein DLAC_11260 [Tieghemostelium lacteum]|eukprot:KYQ88536.1 hypothetical protein DLAC_11260 [Tieghemostelium lacteum]
MTTLINDSEYVGQVRSLLDKEMKIIVNGNRLLKGRLVCFDKQQNLLLAATQEEITLNKDSNNPDAVPNTVKKDLGAVIVPLKHITSCMVLEA